MKVKIQYTATDYNSFKQIKFVETYDCPEFKEIKNDSIKGLPDTYYTIFQQVDNWVGEFDKKDLIIERDLFNILDWEVIAVDNVKANVDNVVKKDKLSNKDTVFLIASTLFKEGNVQKDFVVCYKKLYKNIKDLKPEKQVSIVMDSMGIGYLSSITTLDNLSKSEIKIHFAYNNTDSEEEKTKILEMSNDEFEEYKSSKLNSTTTH